MFEAHPSCELCTLHESASHPGIATRDFDGTNDHFTDTALLIVGQSPGFNEDREGKSFIGYTGQLLSRFIEGAKLTELCDVYLTNAVRCLPPQGANETQSQIKACRCHLQADIDVLRSQGYEHVVLFALGAKAVYSTLHKSSLSDAMKHQGTESPIFPGCTVFCTNHPAILHSRRSPGKVRAIEAHFQMLLRYLKDGQTPYKVKINVELGAPVPDKLPKFVSPDIETYGIIKGQNQTVFHPIKSLVVDGIPFKDQVKMISFAFMEAGKVRTFEYVFRNREHRRIIHEWFRQMSRQRCSCLGQNVKFDLLYLYMSGDPILKYWINPARLRVDDTLLWAFLYYEQQPEKGMKELSFLLGISDYAQMKVTGKTGNAESDTDPNAHIYNCLDTRTTIKLQEYFEEHIRERFGEDSAKLGPICEWMRNAIIWDVFDLERNGSSLNLRRVGDFHDKESTICGELRDTAEEKFGVKFAGTGSDAPLRSLMLDCITDGGLLYDGRVEWTKSGAPSIGVNNVNLVAPLLPEGPQKESLGAYQTYKEHSKIVSTYTGPLLNSTIKGVVTRDGDIGMVYPSWYPIPLYSDRGGSAEGKSGGQIQGRFSCQKPARQTEPPSIRKCSCSRFKGGSIIECDMSQDHLRMAAILSGDPTLMQVYNTEGGSIHMETAGTIFPDLICDDFKSRYHKEYVLCKSLNFAIIFRCGAQTFQQTALHDVGIELDLEFCVRAIKSWSEKYYEYWAWQDRMIRLAGKQGYLVLPTGWSRTFGMGQRAAEVQANEILNFLHQGNCAQLTHSAHYKIQREYQAHHLRSRICLNIYDALFCDRYPGEEEVATEILYRNMNRPPLLPVLEEYYGRSVPWVAELKEYK